MAQLGAPDIYIDFDATLALKRSLQPHDQGFLHSVFSGSCRWHLRHRDDGRSCRPKTLAGASVEHCLLASNISGLYDFMGGSSQGAF